MIARLGARACDRPLEIALGDRVMRFIVRRDALRCKHHRVISPVRVNDRGTDARMGVDPRHDHEVRT
jgi:hypothetical protein